MVQAAGTLGDDLLLPVHHVDLAGERPVRPGFGRFKVVIDRLASARRIQADDQYLILAITKPGGGQISDENGDEAVYSTQAVNGVMVRTLPGLPNTTAQATGSLTADAYVINALVGNWTPFTPPTTYAALTGAGVLGYGSSTNSLFKLDNFGKNLVNSTLPALTANVLQASGYARVDISPGLVPSVTIPTRLHVGKRFSNSPRSLEPLNPTPAEIAGLVASGSANVTLIKNLKSDATGTLRLRHPAFNPDEVDLAESGLGSIPANRRVGRVIVQTSDGSILPAAPAVTVETYDPTAGETTGITPTVSNKVLSFSLTSGSNTAFTLDRTMAWADLDLSGPLAGSTGFTVADLVPAAFNVLDITLSGLPVSTLLRVYFLPVGSAYIMSGATTDNRFK